MAAIIGRKLGMTRVFEEDGTSVPVTVIEAGPCVITRVKTRETDGYEAVQMGFGATRKKSLSKPVLGQFEKAGVAPKRRLTEFRVDDPEQYEVGQEIRADVFEAGQLVNVTGWSRGRGFQGVTKRHGMSTGRQTHGNRNHRKPGSIGQSATPAPRPVWFGLSTTTWSGTRARAYAAAATWPLSCRPCGISSATACLPGSFFSRRPRSGWPPWPAVWTRSSSGRTPGSPTPWAESGLGK